MNHYSRTYGWNEVNDRLYYFRDTTAPNDLMWEAIDQATGIITARGETPYHGTFDMVPPITVSGDGRFVMVGTGDVYDVDTMESVGAISSGQIHARWPIGMGPITLSPVGRGQTLLERRNADWRVEETRLYDGEALGFFELEGRFLVVLSASDAWRFVSYVPSDDSDGDGVANGVDAFPTDPAASRDGDRDGHPDEWNAGRGPADSTSGLVLDAYPENSACFRPDQGDGVRCAVAEQIPDYRPNEIAADEGGTLYLLDASAERVFRWSAITGEHLDPLVVGSRGLVPPAGPRTMAWSRAHARLYLGYPNGTLTYVAPAEGAEERAFATTGRVVAGLVGVGGFVLAQEDGEFRQSRSVFDRDGMRTDWEGTSYFSRAFEWSEANGRVYFFRDEYSPNDLHWEAIDQTTGRGTASDDSPYHGDYEIEPPIRSSPDGARVLLGTGDVYDGLSLEVVDALPAPLVDAAWLGDGSLITIRQGPDGTTLLEQWSDDLVLYFARSFEHAPLRVVATADRVVVVTHDGRVPRFSIYVPTDDGDADGVSNAEDAFPLDPAASQDSDGDGYPDAWNPGRGAEESTIGRVLDAFPLDSACQLPEHALPGQPDRCDIAARIPSYLPSQIVVGDDGTIHLLSSELRRIFRWSIGDRLDLNPLFVGDVPIPGGMPGHLVHSSAHDRLYLGYDSGAITQLDARDPFAGEQPFATTAQPVRGLAAVGAFLLAQDDSGTKETHSSFDRDGRVADRRDMHYYSRAYGWSDVDARVYLFRDSTLPSDLMWESIDQTTGAIGGGLDSPYHGRFVVPPIRVSPDGARVLLGSGEVWSAASLEVVHALPNRLVDAAWLADGSLITIRAGEDGRTVVEQWSEALALYNLEVFEGAPIGIVTHGDEIVVITQRSGRPSFAFYRTSDDGDRDGVVNDEDAYPMDPAASLDSDRDGHPDAWNVGMGEADSTLGLVLDAFPDDFACQLPEHGVGGVCDFRFVLPASRDAAFCRADEPLPPGRSGTLDLPAISDFIPLCDGWMLIGDETSQQILIHNVLQDRRGTSHALSSRPGDLELDEDAKRLYVALPDQLALAVVDLIDGDVTLVPLGLEVRALALGLDGDLFLLSPSGGARFNLHLLSAQTADVQGPWLIWGHLLRFNPATSELLTADSNGNARRHAFGSGTGPLLLQTVTTGYPGELAVSGDGRHVAVASGSGNGPGYVLFDFDASDLAHVRGAYAVGRYPQGAAFDSESRRLLTSNGESLLVFDVERFEELDRHPAPACDYGVGVWVAFSRGDRIAFGRRICGLFGHSARIEWFVPAS
ncbi:MAG: hypothetical protein R3E53_18770 [Myxococcota bacterium]